MKYAIEVLERRSRHRGFLHLESHRLRHSLFRGGWSRWLVRERLEGLRSAAALLYDPWHDRVVLVEQFRIGMLDRGAGAWILEPVGGIVDAGSDAVRTVRREAMEEAGCRVRELEEIGTLSVSPGISDERVTLFCGQVDSARAGGVHGLPGEDEDMRVVVLDAERAFAELFSGRIDSSTAVVTLQWLAAHRDRLRLRWRGAGNTGARVPPFSADAN